MIDELSIGGEAALGRPCHLKVKVTSTSTTFFFKIFKSLLGSALVVQTFPINLINPLLIILSLFLRRTGIEPANVTVTDL